MPNERWSLLGPNGCGKSTLLRQISAAAVDAEHGELSQQIFINNRLRFGMLEQTAVSGSEATVKEEVMSRMAAYQSAKQALEAAEAACVSGAECELEALEAAQSKFEAVGGYTVEKRVSLVLSGLGFEEDEFGKPCSSFSGGWQMRIGLARLLLSEPELLVMDEPTNHLDASARRWLAEYYAPAGLSHTVYISAYSGTVLVVSHDESFVSVACNSIADVDGGRLSLYPSVPLSRYRDVREERRREAISTVEKQKMEEQRLLAVVNKWENVDRSKAAVALKALDKLWPEMEASQALLISRRRPPKLTLADPPKCGIRPLVLEGADVAHAVGAPPILREVDFELERGQRVILRGPNGAGKSTLLKALSGALPLAAGSRREDDRLRLGIFAQDLAQELPQDQRALEYVADSVREFDPTINDERCRTIMGSLGLVGEKATRLIGSLSGGEKARVALATFCLTPYNVLLLDEPTNHLDVDAISALLDAVDTYTGAVVVISHDRPFCESLRATHVGYVCGGACAMEERELRDSDFSVTDRGVRNSYDASMEYAPPSSPALSPEAAKAQRAAEREAQKAAKSATNKLPKLEAKIEAAEGELAEIDAEMLSAGSDVGRLSELGETRGALQALLDAMYAEMEELEAQKAAAAQAVEAALTFGLRSSPPPPPPPPPPSAASDPNAPSKRELNRLKESLDKASKDNKKQKKKKVGKREKEEYATIEADIDELEAAAAQAQAELDGANAGGGKRLAQMELLALASAASEARRAADEKMERYLELEEMLAEA